MFCLRSWIPLLIFLTNASPIYVALFLFAHYSLQRPCVYCSILLFVLVFSLFEFRTSDWFSARWHPLLSSSKEAGTSDAGLIETLTGLLSGNATLADAVVDGASLAVSAVNGSLASAAVDGVRRRMGGGNGNATLGVSGMSSGFEWLRTLLEKKQVRIPCVDVIVRL